MSNIGDGLMIWVGDLDAYVSIDAINRANEQEAEELRLDAELDEIGDIPLLAGKAVSAQTLSGRGIPLSEWRWATHQAEHALHDHQRWTDLEAPFVKELLSLGRRYAVGRYSRWDRVPYPAALTTTFPHGFTALLDQFLSGEKTICGAPQRDSVQAARRRASAERGLTAYDRVGMIRSAIHQAADQVSGPWGHLHLGRDGMRTILSLARLHYSAAELKVGSFRELQFLDCLYETARFKLQPEGDCHPPVLGRHIRNWKLRHLHPLTYLYPYAIRYAITRGLQHLAAIPELPDRAIAVNELALARCGILLMRRKARGRTRS